MSTLTRRKTTAIRRILRVCQADVAVQLTVNIRWSHSTAFTGGADERLQHVHQVGGNLGACIIPIFSMFREPVRAVNRPGRENLISRMISGTSWPR